MAKPEFPRIIFTDDAWLFSSDPPVSAADLREKVVGSYTGTGGALWWSTGDHDVFHFETEIGEIFGRESGSLEGLEDLYSFVHSAGDDDAYPKVAANVAAITAEAGGPLTALLALSQEAGLPFFPRVRMNSHYVVDPRHPAYGNYRRRHPERLITRPGEEFPEGTLEYGIGTGLDYAQSANRDYMASIACECFERFDVDGIELDFMRHPAFFRIEEGYANRHCVTEMIAGIRQRMSAVAAERQRQILLAVRVPPTIADSTRIGLDVARWIADGLVDIVVVGGGFISFETPVDEFVRAAEGSDCLVYGCIEATRHSDDRHLRALAYRWLNDGADGIYFYNFYTRAPEWNRRIAAELTDIERLRRLDKQYELSATGQPFGSSGHSSAFWLAQPLTQVPVRLEPNCEGAGPVLQVRVEDDLGTASAAGELGPCKLALRLKELGEADSLAVSLNGVPLDWRDAEVARDGWTQIGAASLFWLSFPAEPVETHVEGVGVEFAVTAPPLRQGVNEIAVKLRSGERSLEQYVSLIGVEIHVSY